MNDPILEYSPTNLGPLEYSPMKLGPGYELLYFQDWCTINLW